MKKFRVLLLTFVVAVTMMAGSLAVFAAGEETTPANNEISGTITSVPVTKAVDVADGITVPATTFNIYAEQIDNASDEPVAPVTGQAKAKVGEMAVAAGASSQTGTPTLNFDNLTPKAGEYTFTVTEGDENAVETAGADGWQPNSESYKVVVLVKNGQSGLERQYAVYKGETKVTSVDFTNTYLKTGSLTVSKNVTNSDYANLEDAFTVKVTFTKSSTAGDATTFTAKINNVDTTVTYGTPVEITLKHGESASITGVPAGTTYTALDENTGNYTYTDTDYVVNGAEADTGLVGDGENSATVNNEFKEITITGVIMNVLPFVMMIAIAGAAAAMYVVSRRRKMAR